MSNPLFDFASSEQLTSVTDLTPLQTLQETVLGITNDFFGHVPYLMAGLLVLLCTWLFSSLLGKIVGKLTQNRQMRGSLADLLKRLTHIGVWILGLLLTAMVVFPGLTPAKALGGLGIASVAIGFAFKEIFENFFAGILLLWKYPFEKGDFIECESILGRVEDISVRMTQIRRTDGELVVVPNSFLFKNPVKVLTDQHVRRLTVMTGVAYGEDADQAIEVIEKSLTQCKTIDSSKPVQVFLHGFGDSAIEIEVTWWASPTPLDHRRSKSEVVSTVKRALDEAGIEIPFPHRTLLFKEALSVNNSTNQQTTAQEPDQ